MGVVVRWRCLYASASAALCGHLVVSVSGVVSLIASRAEVRAVCEKKIPTTDACAINNETD